MSISPFTDELLQALGDWQRGWREDQSRRSHLADRLVAEAAVLPKRFRECSQLCYRKRFIYKGELVDVVVADNRDEGVASWTTNLVFAERFKGVYRTDAVSAAIFAHEPVVDEVVVNFNALWADKQFVAAVENLRSRGGPGSDALLRFRDGQGEVVLTAPLRGSEIIALTGASSPFDDLCDKAGIPQTERDGLFQKLVGQGVYPGEVQYIGGKQVQRVIERSIQQLFEKIEAHKRRLA